MRKYMMKLTRDQAREWHARQSSGDGAPAGDAAARPNGSSPSNRRLPTNQEVRIAWQTKPVLNSAECPFSSLRAWGNVIRFRSDDIIMIEFAVPEDKLGDMRTIYGAQLERLGEETEARVELGSLAEKSGVQGRGKRMYSLLLSGSLDEVARVNNALRIYKLDGADYHHARTRRNASKFIAGKPTAVAAAKPAVELPQGRQALHEEAWRDKPVYSHIAIPSNKMRAWDVIFRHRSANGDEGTIETVVPEDIWESMQRGNFNAERVARETGAAVEVGQEAFAPASDSLQHPALITNIRSILITGSLRQLWQAVTVIGGFKSNTQQGRDTSPNATVSREIFDRSTVIRAVGKNNHTIRTISISRSMRAYLRGRQGEFYESLKRLSGAKAMLFKPGPDKQTALLEVHGESQACERALALVTQATQYACQHADAKLYHKLQSKLQSQGVSFPRKPDVFSRIQLPPSLPLELRRDIMSHVVGPHGDSVTELQLLTLCQIESPPDQPGVWTITGPKEGIGVAKEMLQKKVEEKCNVQGVAVVMVLEIASGAVEDRPARQVDTSGKESVQGSENTRGEASGGMEKAPPRLSVGRAENTEKKVEIPSEEEIAKLADDVRTALRPLTHPVVLITSRHVGTDSPSSAPGHNPYKRSRGVTVSSFATITLQPKPVISFNLKLPSRTWDAISGSQRLAVHFLAATPKAAALTHAFTLPHERPEQPFAMVKAMGGGVFPRNAKLPTTLRLDGAIFAWMEATLMEAKCVEVGDHVVVVAEVQAVHLINKTKGEPKLAEDEVRQRVEGTVGLAYAKRAYRGIGDAIEVAELPTLEDVADAAQAAELGGQAEETHLAEEDDADVFAPEEKGRGTSSRSAAAQSADDAGFDYFRAAQEPDEEEVTERTSRGESRRTAAIEEEDDYDLGFGSSGEAEQQLAGPFKVSRGPGVARSQLSEQVNGVLDVARKTPRNVSWPPGRGALQQKPSRLAHVRLRSSDQTRSYSTGAAVPFGGDADANDRKSDASQHVTDPSLLTQTVAHFLGQPQEGVKPPRMRALLNAKTAAESASQQLERALASGTLTEEQSLRLEHTITVNERRVAKQLALRAADDLRRMLDEGNVDVRRAQWLEQAVEKGMVVVVEEAKQVRGMFDQGSVGEQQFGLVREKLERQHGVLNTEAMRLRAWFEDEEGEVFDDAGSGDAEGARFDGFGRNV